MSKHTPLPSGDWKKYLIKTEPSYDGSFADADIQKFRPNPTPSLNEDPWYTSRLPGHVSAGDMTSVPSDTLTQIKMRNRRFQQSCAMEGAQHGLRPAQMMMMQPVNNHVTEDMMMMATMAYTDLQRQVNMLQPLPSAPVQAPRLNLDEDPFLTVDSLPAPRKVAPKQEQKVEEEPSAVISSHRGVAIGDQIAIRSILLGKTL